MASSENLFKLLLKLRVFAGLFTIESTNKPKFLMYTYLIGMMIIFFVQIITQIFVITYKLGSLNDGSDGVCLIAMFTKNCIIIIFNLIRGSRCEENYKNTIKLVDEILNFSSQELGQKTVKRYKKYVNFLICMYAMNVNTLQIIQIVIKALSFMKVTDLVPDYYLWIYAQPWPVNWYTYWPTLTLEGLSTFFMILVQQVNLYFIMTMMVLQTLGFQQLKVTLADVIRFSSNDQDENHKIGTTTKPYYIKELTLYSRKMEQHERLKTWIQLHSGLINLSREFVQIYAPMFLSFFFVMFVILLAAVFALMQNFDFFGIAEAILLSLYFSGIMFNLLVLSVTGSNLTLESGRVFENAFQEPWYNCEPEVKSCLKIICNVSKRPIVVVPFGCEAFTMSLHTFIWVMRTLGSTYIGLAEVKRRANIE